VSIPGKYHEIFDDKIMIRISLLTAALALASIVGCSGPTGSLTQSTTQSAEAAYAIGDYKTALQKWRPRADNGDAEAQYGLGYMYRGGQGVAQDVMEAKKWYERAANLGHVKSQVKLGLIFAKGDGIQQNLVLAHKWFNIAAANGDKSASQARDKIAKIMSVEEIKEALRLARAFSRTR
jgi:uncharacterized protein